VEGPIKVREDKDKTFMNEIMKVSVVIEKLGDDTTRMPTISILMSNSPDVSGQKYE